LFIFYLDNARRQFYLPTGVDRDFSTSPADLPIQLKGKNFENFNSSPAPRDGRLAHSQCHERQADHGLKRKRPQRPRILHNLTGRLLRDLKVTGTGSAND
jgi:hypothetical protein